MVRLNNINIKNHKSKKRVGINFNFGIRNE